MKHRITPVLVMLAALASGSAVLTAQAPAEAADEPSTDELIRQEQIREQVDEAIADSARQSKIGELRLERAERAAQRVLALGNDALPYLEERVVNPDPRTFTFVVWVLGLMPTPEAEQLLQQAVTEADLAGGGFGFIREAWASWALGIHGDAEVIRGLAENNNNVISYQVSQGTTLVESIGMMTAPESVPILLEKLAGYASDERRVPDRVSILKALRRIADPSAAPAVIALMKDPEVVISREAATTLGAMDTPRAVKALMNGLKSELLEVRRHSAGSLARLRPEVKTRPLFEMLETENDTVTRGSLYRLLAALEGDDSVKTLAKYATRPEVKDRLMLIAALSSVTSDESAELLGGFLLDADTRISVQAADALARIGTTAARKQLYVKGAASSNWTLAQAAIEHLAALGEKQAAPGVKDRLVHGELGITVTDPWVYARARKLCEALVALEYTAAVPELSEAAARQKDKALIALLDHTIEELEAIAEQGDDVAAWVETSRSSDASLRSLAYTRLSELGGKKASAALVEAFGRVEEIEEQVAVVEALGRTDTPPARALLRRILFEPEFESFLELKLREMAAWSARRIGGDEMFAMLRDAVDRHDGGDFKVFVYAMVLGGERALPLLEKHRIPRMQRYGWTLGLEQERLDALATAIEKGLPLTKFDVPPVLLKLRG